VALLLGVALAPPMAAHGLTAPVLGSAGPSPDGPGAGSPVAGIWVTQPAPAVTPSASTPAAPAPALTRDPSGVLPGLPWEAAGGLSVSRSGTPWKALVVDGKPVAPGAANQGTVRFWCPSLDGGTTITDGTNTMTIRATCPYRIADDADLLGSPQIAVHAADPNSVAFFSLHGGGSTEGPTPRSRDPSPDGLQAVTGLSHTTFTSQDHGRSWHDNPWGTDGFGEHASGTMDRDGNLYIAALWSKRLAEDRFNYVIKVYKEQDGRYTIATYQPSKTLSNRADGNTITGADIVYVPAPLPPPPAANATGNATGNGTAPADPSQVGNYTNGESYGLRNGADDRVVAVWFERALDWRNSTTGKSSWIDAAWSDTSSRDNWTRLADDQLIGPCMAASNPVAYDGRVYVACVADAGYDGRSRARVGDVDVWSIDPRTGKTRLEEHTGLVGGAPRLVAREDGYMAAATVEVRDEANVEAHISFGWYGRHWRSGGGVLSVGQELHTLMGGHRVREARITSMALTEEKNTLFLTYMERVNVTARAPEANPSVVNTDPGQAIEYRKLVATYSQCSGAANDAYDLQTGVARHPFNEAVLGDTTGVFDDLQDGMQYWRDPSTGEERVYFAYADHGVVQFGAIVGGTSGGSCPVLQPPPQLPPPPIPAALSTASPYSMLVGSTVGATALAMVVYLLAAKRRTLTFSAAKDKRR
jgi:hypothetical protein